MKKIAEINCGNIDCIGRLAIYENGAYRSLGTHYHKKDDGTSKIIELRRLSLKEKKNTLQALYGFGGGLWDLKLFV